MRLIYTINVTVVSFGPRTGFVGPNFQIIITFSPQVSDLIITWGTVEGGTDRMVTSSIGWVALPTRTISRAPGSLDEALNSRGVLLAKSSGKTMLCSFFVPKDEYVQCLCLKACHSRLFLGPCSTMRQSLQTSHWEKSRYIDRRAGLLQEVH